jgi:hypothetical protein
LTSAKLRAASTIANFSWKSAGVSEFNDGDAFTCTVERKFKYMPKPLGDNPIRYATKTNKVPTV